MEKVKRFRFPRGVNRVNVPFMLNDLSPWQDQVKEYMEKTLKRLGTNKRASWGYCIENGSAEIYVYKY
jgi:hypothetical protein